MLFDSLYGNTKAVAEAIGRSLGADARVVHIKDIAPAQLAGHDLIIIGSPTHGGRPSAHTKAFLAGIASGQLHGIRVAAFDTRGSVEDQGAFVKWLVNLLGYAGKHILQTLEKKGGIAIAPPEGFLVNGKEGPLQEGELERAAAWAAKLRDAEATK